MPKTIYRPQSVQPDIDDVLVRPNMARAAENLRFSAGEDDTNLGITAVRGNRVLDSGRFVEGQQTIGFCISEELGAIFQAIWRPTSEHSIEMIEPRLNNKITTVAIGSWLKFQNTSFVSMAFVDGKLYFTDKVNPPRLLNVNKAINTWGGGTGDEVYLPEPPEWTVSRVKRQPAFALTVFRTNRDEIIFKDFNPEAPNQGYQFAYYYVYDNFENSRLSPYSEVVVTTKGVDITMPLGEKSYIDTENIIKEIVIAYRLGNLGTWYELKRIKPSGGAIRYVISDMRLAPKVPIPGELLTDQFDDVPLTSGWNAVIENRLIDADFVQGYDTVDTLSLEASFTTDVITEGIEIFFLGNRTFKPGKQSYNVGLELLDESGRRIGVVNQTTVTTPDFTRWYERPAADSPTANYFRENNPFFKKDSNTDISLRVTVNGQFPSWAKYARVVYSRNQSVNSFYRTQAKMLFWYTDNGQDFFVANTVSTLPNPQNPFGTVLQFQADGTKKYEGIVVFLAQDEPFLIDSSKVNYLDLIGAVHLGAMDNRAEPTFPRTENYNLDKFRKIAKKYVITKQEENKLFIRLKDQEKLDWFTMNYLGNPPIGLTPDEFRYYTTSLDISLEIQKDTQDQFYYQTSAIRSVNPNFRSISFTLFGDCYLTNFKKTYRGVRTVKDRTLIIDDNSIATGTIGPINPDINAASTFDWGAGSFDIYGTYVAMNPTDIYNQNWDSDIGQSTIVNPNQEQKTFKNTPLLSNPLFLGTKVNGLSQVSSLDQPDQYSLDAGPITGIISTTGVGTEPGVVLFICENNWFSTYLNATEIQLGQGTGALSVADRFFGSRRLLQGRYGTKLRNTIQGTDKNFVYAYSDKVKDIIRYSGEGLQALGVTHGFGNLLDKEVGNGTSVSLGYDSFYDEIILVNKLTQEAYVYSERYKAFQGKRKYGLSPDFLGSLNENLYSTANGNYYVSDRSADMGRFYGLTPDIKLTIIANDNYAITKLWQHIELYCDMPELITLTTPDGKFTTLEPFEMEDIKDRLYGSFRCEENSNGGKYNGSLIESNLCSIEIIWNFATFDINKFKINQIVVGAVPAIAQ